LCCALIPFSTEALGIVLHWSSIYLSRQSSSASSQDACPPSSRRCLLASLPAALALPCQRALERLLTSARPSQMYHHRSGRRVRRITPGHDGYI
jgi:hypothetical protein